jgi:hypothetical protein
MTNALMGHQFKILPAEGVAVACGEIRKGHFESTADFGFNLVNLACNSVRRKPFAHCAGIEECSIDSLSGCTQHAVKSDGVRSCHMIALPFGDEL